MIDRGEGREALTFFFKGSVDVSFLCFKDFNSKKGADLDGSAPSDY